MNTLRFSKMHGLGNDFMVINGVDQSVTLQPEIIRQWADRHFGIGFDQLLLVEPADTHQADFKYRIFNADGGEVSQCGNGARCFARFVRDQGLSDASEISVETHAGLLTLHLLEDGLVRVNMGVPRLKPAQIPLLMAHEQALYEADENGQRIAFSAVSMGNPHMVIRVDDVATAAVETLGPLWESHPLFPERVNVGFLEIVDRQQFKLRVFERGVGETLACGSGACAAMVAACRNDWLDHHATASLLGGELQLEWQGLGQPVWMSGPATTVFSAELPLTDATPGPTIATNSAQTGVAIP